MTTAFMELADQRNQKPIAEKEKKHIHDGLEQLLDNHRNTADFFAYCQEINKQLSKLVREANEQELSGIDAARFRGELAKEGFKAYGPTCTVEQHAKKIGISRQAVLKRLKAGTLLGWRENSQNAYRIPSWQFDAEGNLLPGMAQVLKELNVPEFDEWAKILFFLQQRNSLKGKRPIELIVAGKTEAVVLLAREYAQ